MCLSTDACPTTLASIGYSRTVRSSKQFMGVVGEPTTRGRREYPTHAAHLAEQPCHEAVAGGVGGHPPAVTHGLEGGGGGGHVPHHLAPPQEGVHRAHVRHHLRGSGGGQEATSPTILQPRRKVFTVRMSGIT
eukprot:1191540-Prorocentrum_minimum.AAC.1